MILHLHELYKCLSFVVLHRDCSGFCQSLICCNYLMLDSASQWHFVKIDKQHYFVTTCFVHILAGCCLADYAYIHVVLEGTTLVNSPF